EPRPLVDSEGRIVAVLAGQPRDSRYQQSAARVYDALVRESQSAAFGLDAAAHRRGRFPALNVGAYYGNGTRTAVNLNSRADPSIAQRLLANPDVERLANFASGELPFWAILRDSAPNAPKTHGLLIHYSTSDRLYRSYDALASLQVGILPRFYQLVHLTPRSAFEQAPEQHATHPTLEPTYNPMLLARAPQLSANIAYLLEIPEPSWKNHLKCLALLKVTPPALKAYVDRVQELAKAPDPSPLLAHSCVRYLGDLSGGQTIRRTIAKAYDLD
ncbi:hypothetical protein C0992_008513, partial [Termitomyces sp. T32_za158]